MVNALVEATPISGPAFVKIENSDSLAMVLVGTLQMVSVDKKSFSLAYFNAASVSAVSPDCEIVTKRASSSTCGFLYLYSDA